MTVDELMLKIGIDQSQVGPGLDDFKRKVIEAAGVGKKSFLSLGSEAGAFRQSLNAITSTMPGVGAAIRFALNPIVALFAALTAAVVGFREEQREAARESEEAARSSAQAWVSAQQAIHSANPQAALASRTSQEAVGGATASANVDDESVLGQRKKVPLLGSLIGVGQWIAENVFGDTRPDEERAVRRSMRESVARATALSALKAEQKNRERDNVYGMLQEALEEEYDLEEEKREALNDEIDAIIKHDDALLKTIEVEEKARSVKQASAARAAESLEQDYKLSIGELSEFNTPAGQQARYIQWLEQGARWQRASGDVKGAEETIFGKGGIKELRAQLSGAGIIKRDVSELFEATLDGKGNLKVNIVEGAE